MVELRSSKNIPLRSIQQNGCNIKRLYSKKLEGGDSIVTPVKIVFFQLDFRI